MTSVLGVVLLLSWIGNSWAGAANVHEQRLIRDIMKRYDKRVRPSLESDSKLNVTFGLALAQLIDVNWMDINLAWDPVKFGNIQVIRLPYKDIWLPDILLYDNADVSSYTSQISTNVIVAADGNVTWLSMAIYKSSCSINVQYFPFDKQNCTMRFASWTFGYDSLDLLSNNEKGDISNYIDSSEWVLNGFVQQRQKVFFSCCPNEPYIFINYYILIERRPLFYLFNMVMPCMFITMVALLGFYMPSDSGEKISMGITTLLSMTVFLMIISDIMPPTSDVVPLIGMYYGITIAIVSCATAMTVVTLNIHHKGTRGCEVPAFIRKIGFGILPKLLFIKLDLPGLAERTTEKISQEYFSHHCAYDAEKLPENGGLSPRFARKINPPGQGAGDYEKQFSKVLQKVYHTIERNEIRLAEQDRRDTIKLEWQQLAIVVDRLFLFGFIILTIVVTVCILFNRRT